MFAELRTPVQISVFHINQRYTPAINITERTSDASLETKLFPKTSRHRRKLYYKAISPDSLINFKVAHFRSPFRPPPTGLFSPQSRVAF